MIMSNICDLPDDVLLLVVQKVENFSDYIRFSGVCRSWRLVAKRDSHRVRHRLPVLISSNSRRMILPITKSKYQDPLPKLSLPQNGYCRGSYKGWVAMVNPNLTMHIQNPVTGQQIDLPSIRTLLERERYWFDKNNAESVVKVVLSSEPGLPGNDQYCYVLVIYCAGAVAYCKLGDAAWSPISDIILNDEYPIKDAINHKGQFLLLQDFTGDIFGCRFSSSQGPNPTLTKFVKRGMNTWENEYLVECGGEVLLIRRSREYGYQEGGYWCCEHGAHTTKFVVYKHDDVKEEWFQVKDLGDYALFVGRNQTFSVLASSSSSSSVDVAGGIQRNHIYFTDDFNYANANSAGTRKVTRCDSGIYDLRESKIINQLHSHIHLEEPLWWVVPTLN